MQSISYFLDDHKWHFYPKTIERSNLKRRWSLVNKLNGTGHDIFLIKHIEKISIVDIASEVLKKIESWPIRPAAFDYLLTSQKSALNNDGSWEF